jgi:predicted metal-binding membrane protein
MWFVMMVAMMTPSVAPAVLLYGRVYRQSSDDNRLAPASVFCVGYLVVWFVFAVAAAGAHWALEKAGLVSASTMGSQNKWLSAGILIAAGLYQLTPLKNLCLALCQQPAYFISQNWRPGYLGALRLGVRHGMYCLTCCYLLMALLFVGGVMNLLWIAALAILVLAEKLAPGRWTSRSAGAALIVWGLATLAL